MTGKGGGALNTALHDGRTPISVLATGACAAVDVACRAFAAPTAVADAITECFSGLAGPPR